MSTADPVHTPAEAAPPVMVLFALPVLDATSPQDLTEKIRSVIDSPEFTLSMLAAANCAQPGKAPAGMEFPQSDLFEAFGLDAMLAIEKIQTASSALVSRAQQIAEALQTPEAAHGISVHLEGVAAASALACAVRERRNLAPWLVEALIGLWRRGVEAITELIPASN
jgi:hypothetical protein